MDLFKLVGTIAINNQEANAEIDKTSEKASSFGSKLSSGMKTAAKWGTAIVGGATVASTALVGFATKSASTADHIDKMSQKIGISRQAYQELDFICSQSGMSVDQLQMGIKTLTAKMDSGSKAFDTLSVSVKNSDGTLRSQEEVMYDTISALQGCENQTEKARLATELFGRSGTEMMPLLNSASGSVEKMKKQAHDLGLVLNDELIDNGVNLTDSMDQTKRAFASVGTQLMGSLMPVVEKLSDNIQNSLPKIQSLVTKLAPIITSLLEGLLPPLFDLADSIFPVLFNLMEQLLPPATEIVQALLPIVVELLNLVLPLVEPLLPLIKPLVDLLGGVASALKWLSDNMNITIPIIGTLTASIVAYTAAMKISALIQTVSTAIKAFQKANEGATVAQWAINTAMNANPIGIIITAIGALVGAIILLWNNCEWFRDGWTQVWDGIKQIVKSVWDALSSFFNAVIEWLKPIIANVGNALKTIWDNVSAFCSNAFNVIQTVIGSIVSAVTVAWEAISGFFTAIWDSLQPLFQSIGGAIQSGWELLQTIWGLIQPFLEGALNTVISIFQFAWDGIKAIWDAVQPYFQGIWEGIQSVFSVVSQWFGALFSVAWETVKAVWNNAVNFFQLIWTGIKGTFSVVATFFKGAFGTAWELIKGIWNGVTGFFKAIWDTVKGIFDAVKSVLSGDFSGAWEAIKGIVSSWGDFFKSVWNGIKNIFGSVASWFGDVFKKAFEAIKNVFSGIGNFFKGVWDGIVGVFSTIGTKVADAIGGAFKAAINAVIGIVEGAINFIPNAINGAIWLINKLPGVNIPEMPTISIPRLAKGGVLKKGQTGYLEGDGDEAVVPLSQNTEWIKNVAQQIHQFTVESKMGISDFIPNNVANKLDKSVEYQNQQIKRLDVITMTLSNLQSRIMEALNLIHQDMGYNLVLDTGVLVAETAEQMDEQLELIYKRKGR